MIALALALAISGQTTNCSRDVLGDVECVTKPPLSAEERAKICEGATTFLMRYATGCTANETKRAREATALKERVGGLLASGQCDAAKTEALKAGDFDLAERVQKLCAPKP